jgi:outer membrane murein-binding lipoprotein Lpp
MTVEDLLQQIAALARQQNLIRADVAAMRLEVADAASRSVHPAGFPARVGRDIANLTAAVGTLRHDHDELSEEVANMARRPGANGGS